MTYDPATRVYYSPYNDLTNSEYRLVPAPNISINTKLNYVNDNVVGYKYIVTLNGYATALDLTQEQETNYGIDLLAEKIDQIKNIFALNGGVLNITDNNNNVIIRAFGGIVKSLNFEQSNNNWVNYAPYSVELEFNNINYSGCASNDTFNCNNTLFDINGYNNSLVDIDKYKIESFDDSWSFNLDDNVYNRYNEFHNQHFAVEYTVSAVGQTFFVNDKLIPPWEQAKNFCQNRLYDQVVNGLIRNILEKSNTDSDSCDPTKSIDTLHDITSNNSGVLANLSNSLYGVYNETIDCETSESDGSFGLTYKALIKKKNITGSYYADSNLHTFTVNKAITDDNSSKNITITVQGNIQGLIPGGLVRNHTTLELPNNGTLIVSNDLLDSSSKYEYALIAYNKIINDNADDLSSDFKTFLGITNSQLDLGSCAGEVKNSSHNVDHNYAEGTIGYSTVYSNSMACFSNPIRNISITRNDPTPIIAEFIIPGRSMGPLIQKIGASSPRTISVRINGVSDNLKCCFDPGEIITSICSGVDSVLLPSSGIPSEEIDSMILQKNNYTSNPIDGSFVIQREYICCDS